MPHADDLLETVPNFSDGTDRATLDALGDALERGARVLDLHADADHGRSVFTCVGDEDGLVDALAGAVAVAVERIDLRRHRGAHPRVGAADVVPLVQLAEGDERPRRAALRLAQQLGELGLPVLPYGLLAGGLRPAHYRSGGLERLAARLRAGEVRPLAGPSRLHPTAGAVILGVRPPLVAFNVDLDSDRLDLAREIAACIREQDGGLPGVQALGLRLGATGRVQVSTNLVDVEATPLWRVVEEVERLAAERGVAVHGSELVGLVPAHVAAAAAGRALRLPAMGADRLLEVAALGELGAPRRPGA
jgi:glutamate formiminotransferase